MGIMPLRWIQTSSEEWSSESSISYTFRIKFIRSSEYHITEQDGPGCITETLDTAKTWCDKKLQYMILRDMY